VTACLLQPNDAGDWVATSRGRYVAAPGAYPVAAEFSGTPEMGFERLEVRGEPVEEGGFDFVNTAISDSGNMTTWETWSAPEAGRFNYVVERAGAEGREVWFAGQWERVSETAPAGVCDPA